MFSKILLIPQELQGLLDISDHGKADEAVANLSSAITVTILHARITKCEGVVMFHCKSESDLKVLRAKLQGEIKDFRKVAKVATEQGVLQQGVCARIKAAMAMKPVVH